MISISDFNRETECVYRERRYSVRDNGAVYRHPRDLIVPNSAYTQCPSGHCAYPKTLVAKPAGWKEKK